MRKILLSLLMIFFFSGITKGQELSNEDIIKITKYAAKSRITGLGEEEHFYRGSNEGRIEIIKEIIKANTIQAIIFETPGTDAFVVNKYIHNKISKSRLLEYLQQFKQLNGGPFFDCNEMVSFFEWLKERTTKGNDVEIYGIDFYNYIEALDNLQKLKKEKDSSAKIRKAFDTLTRMLHDSPYQLVNEDVKKIALDNFNLIKSYLSKINTSSSALFRNSANDIYNYACWFTNLNARDSIMFQNFTKIDNSNKRILIWAANFHIQKDSLQTPYYTSHLFGSFMTKKYKSQYLKIGTFSANPCTKEDNARVLLPDINCDVKDKFDVIVTITKGERTTSIFDK
ncbi:MAG: erythromycin esterase family protein [Agriterribacter sp.]